MIMFHLKYFEEVCSYNLESKEFLSLLPQIEVEESLAVNDHKGNEHGLLQVSTLSASSSQVSRILKGWRLITSRPDNRPSCNGNITETFPPQL